VIPLPVAELVAALAAMPASAPAARIEGDERRLVQGLATLASAQAHELSFLANPKYRQQLATTAAGAVIVSDEVAVGLQDAPFTRIVTPQPYLYYAKAAQWFEARLNPLPAPRIHLLAAIDPEARVEAGADVGAFAVIDAGAVVEAGARIGAGAYVGRDCHVAAGSIVHPQATLHRKVRLGRNCIIHGGAVLGADGFGFAPDGQGGWEKIPQLGGVLIGDDVEIGATTAVDRGALDDTVIEDGAKLDNHIQIGHNVRIGAQTILAGCTAIAGSTVIGRRCTIGGASIIVGHIQIADEVVISAATVVMASITKPGRYTGAYPMDTHANWEKNAAVLRQLPELRRRLRALEQKK
jgi:UDP-3-O-[3-hydroxymyristoyl] glucosamine N-acyltransferase